MPSGERQFEGGDRWLIAAPDAGRAGHDADLALEQKAATRSRGWPAGSRIGARYRHTTDEMAAREVDAIQARLEIVLRVAEEVARAGPNREPFRVF